MKSYRIKCYYKRYGMSGRIMYMPQVKRLFWWADLVYMPSIWNGETKSKESAIRFIEALKSFESYRNMPIEYIDVD